MPDLHKNDPGIYQITCYDDLGRKKKTELATTFSASIELARSWAAQENGSAVVHRCLFNSKLNKPTYPASEQS